ncbi:MAG: hypothetical protein HQL51_01935 [Magnetococcales bacterium]|nr:hypothetical protein [Magnetococcales bacterium]
MRRCWETMRCGRQPGGSNVARQGECPVSRLEAGVCWLSAGPHAPPELRCSRVTQGGDCHACPYYHEFHHELALHMTPAEVEIIAQSWVELCT